LAISTIGGPTPLDRVADNQAIWASTMDVQLLHATSDYDPSPTAYNRQAPAAPATLPGEETSYIQTLDGNNVIPGTVT